MTTYLLIYSLFILPASIFCLNCTVCPFNYLQNEQLPCTDTCEGDVCYIVVTKYFNGTIIAGCIKKREGDELLDGAVCHRDQGHTLCGCSGEDYCNSPTSPLSSFTLSDSKILEGYQIMPAIQPTHPDHELPDSHEMSTDVDEDNSEENVIEVQSSMTVQPPLDSPSSNSNNSHDNMPHPNTLPEDTPVNLTAPVTEPRNQSLAEEMTMVKTVGLKVGENLENMESEETESLRPKGEGSVELAAVSSGPDTLHPEDPTDFRSKSLSSISFSSREKAAKTTTSSTWTAYALSIFISSIVVLLLALM